MQEPKRLTLEDRLFLVKRKVARESHIEVDQEGFKKCRNAPILYICPAKVFILNEESEECIVNFENCLECGTCQVTCREFVKWKNPASGFGVTYNYG